MDTKNDDSGGSDSLDKSLQKKCVVDDVGQGEGSTSGGQTLGTTQRTADGQRAGNSTKKQKTEKQVGDGNSGGGSGVGTSSAAGSGGCGSSSTTNDTEGACTANKQQISLKQQQQDDKAHAIVNTTKNTESKSPTTTNETSSSLASSAASTNSFSASPSSNNSKTEAANCNNNNSNSNNAFETKVKQISKNLKETTLAETTTTSNVAAATPITTTTPTLPTSHKEQNNVDEYTSTASSSTPSPSISTPTASSATSPDGTNTTVNTDEQGADNTAMNSSMISDSNDDADSRSKKVRFHPDVKENDGGNRVIPKKKKKLKANAGGSGIDGASTSAQAGEEMDLDEEDDYEEDDEFDLAKTIAEAQDYLKEHPLTFVRPCDKSAGRLQNGLLEEEDIQHLDASEEEEFIDAVIPENGIERILGKQTKGGRVEFLLRFTNQPGLFWESEDFIATQCPSLLTQYEFNRERRQERLMRHVAKRQNLRQRYTDF